MSLTNITATAVNGVQEISSAQNIASNASAIDESLLLRASGALRASGSATIQLTRCNVTVDNVASGSGAPTPNVTPLSYNGDNTDRTVTSRAIRLNDTQLVYKTAAERMNIFLSELTRSKIIESNSGSSRLLFVYTQPNAIINDAFLYRCNVMEVRPFQQITKLRTDSCNYGMLNYEAGRVDPIYANFTNVVLFDVWMGNGAAGNTLWLWNPVSFDLTKCIFNATDNVVYRGWTICWEFKNIVSRAAVADVLVILRDDRATPGTAVEVGRWVTNASGRLAGTKDSRTLAVGSDTERGALYVLTDRTAQNASGSYGSGSTVIGPGLLYNLVTVTPRIEIRAYEYRPAQGYGAADTLTVSSPTGSVAGDYSAESFSPFFLTPDSSVVATKSAALAYTSLDTPQKFYDRCKAEWAQTDGRPVPSYDGSTIDIGAANLVIDATASSAYAYAAGTLTVKAASINGAGSIVTTGTINFANGAVQGTTLLYGSNYSTPVSATFTVANLVPGSRLLIRRTDTQAVLVNAVVAGSSYGYLYQYPGSSVPVEVVVRNSSGSPSYLEWRTTASLGAVDSSVNANQVQE
jgi:hypothetical protein